MKITSPDFQDGQHIPACFTCDGNNINPALIFSDIPSGTESLALLCHDPDAPRPGGWTHWMVINISPNATGVGQGGQLSSGVELVTDFGDTGYGGPCPPHGEHRYFFYLYALDKTLDLPRESTKDDLLEAMHGHILEQAQLMGLYARQ